MVLKLVDLGGDCTSDETIVDKFVVMISAPLAEIMNERFLVKIPCEMLSKALLELLCVQEAVLVKISIFDCAPNFRHFEGILLHERGHIAVINLLQALKFDIQLLLGFVFLNCNDFVNAVILAGDPG